MTCKNSFSNLEAFLGYGYLREISPSCCKHRNSANAQTMTEQLIVTLLEFFKFHF